MDSHIPITELLEKLNSLDKLTREAAFEALVAYGSEALPFLLEHFEHIEGAARLSVVRAFGEIGDPRAVPLLLELMCGDDPGEYLYVASFAAKALGQIADATAVQALLDALNHENPRPRQMAALILGKIGDERVVPALSDALRDPDPKTRELAMRALKQIATPKALAAVEAARRQVGKVKMRQRARMHRKRFGKNGRGRSNAP